MLTKFFKFKCIVLTLVLSGCSSIFYHPTKELVIAPSDLNLEYHEHIIENGAIRLHGWHLPAAKKDTELDFPPVLFLHGNAQNISNHLPSVAWLPPLGFEVYLFDYQGYGLSSGSPSPAAVTKDVEQMINYIDAHRSECIILFGQSLGATLALFAASNQETKEKLCLVVAESPFADYHLIVREKLSQFWITYPFIPLTSLLINNNYSPLPVVKDISPIPILLIHSKADPIVPTTHSQALFSAAEQPKELWLLEDVPHIMAFSNRKLQQRFVDFVKTNVIPQIQEIN